MAVWLALTERCDSGCHFPIGIETYRFRNDMSVFKTFVRTRFLGCVCAAPLAFALSLTGCKGHNMTRPYQLLACALQPASATTSTESDLGWLRPVPSPLRQ